MATLVSDSGVRGNYPSLVGGNSTGVLVFPAVLGPGFNNGGNALANLSQAVKPAQVVTQNSAEGQQFTIKGAGNIHVAAGTVLFKLYAGTSLTAASNSLIASCSAQTLSTGAYYPFAFSITLQGDANSGDIQAISPTLTINGGSVTFTVNQGGSPPEAGIPLVGQDLLTTPISFCLAAQFGTGNSSNQVALQQFILEQ